MREENTNIHTNNNTFNNLTQHAQNIGFFGILNRSQRRDVLWPWLDKNSFLALSSCSNTLRQEASLKLLPLMLVHGYVEGVVKILSIEATLLNRPYRFLDLHFNFTDSAHQFSDYMTIYQYANLMCDTNMCKAIVPFFDENSMSKQEQESAIKGFSHPSGLQRLIAYCEAEIMFVNSLKSPDHLNRKNCWNNLVDAQKKFPAWMIHILREKNQNNVCAITDKYMWAQEWHIWLRMDRENPQALVRLLDSPRWLRRNALFHTIVASFDEQILLNLNQSEVDALNLFKKIYKNENVIVNDLPEVGRTNKGILSFGEIMSTKLLARRTAMVDPNDDDHLDYECR